jgi:hypothetical protein
LFACIFLLAHLPFAYHFACLLAYVFDVDICLLMHLLAYAFAYKFACLLAFAYQFAYEFDYHWSACICSLAWWLLDSWSHGVCVFMLDSWLILSCAVA